MVRGLSLPLRFPREQFDRPATERLLLVLSNIRARPDLRVPLKAASLCACLARRVVRGETCLYLVRRKASAELPRSRLGLSAPQFLHPFPESDRAPWWVVGQSRKRHPDSPAQKPTNVQNALPRECPGIELVRAPAIPRRQDCRKTNADRSCSADPAGGAA